MKRAAIFAVTVSLVSLSFLTVEIQPADSQPNWAHMLGQVPQMVDAGTRQTQMLKSIDDAAAHGRLTAANAASFKAELERIKQIEVQYRLDGDLSVWERMRLAFELDNLQSSIDASLSPRTAILSDIPECEAQITREISDALFTGRLTRGEGDMFLAELDSIQSKQAAYQADGTMSNDELLALSLDLDKLQQSVHAKIKPLTLTDVGSESLKNSVKGRIKELVGTGKITLTEANSLRQELSDIESREVAFKAKTGKLDTNAALTLAIELEKLSNKLNQFQPVFTCSSPAIDQRQQELEKLITDALYSGKMTSLQVFDLKQDFDRVSALEATFRIDGTLSEAETSTLTRDLDSLKAKIQLYCGAASQQTMAERIAEAKKRLKGGESAGRLTDTAAQELHDQLGKIESRHSLFMEDGKLDDKETLALASDIDTFKINFDKAVKPLPDISARRAEIERKINDALGADRLRPNDAKDLKAELVRINGLEASIRASEGGISDPAVFALAKELDALSERIDKSLPVLPDLAAREAAIQKRINESARSGSITEDDRRDFSHEFDRIKDVETAFRSSDNILSDWEAVTVSQDLDRLEAEISRSINANVKSKGKDASADTPWKIKPQK